MLIEKGYFYFISDDYFGKVKDNELMKNKDRGIKRPCFYCMKDDKVENLFWLIPISSKISKYKRIYDNKLKKQIDKGKTPNVDTIVFGKLNNEERVFLIQNMFPIIPKYISDIYCRNNKPVRISYELQNEIESKVAKVFKLFRKGNKGLIFPNIIRIKNIMVDELEISKNSKKIV